MGFIISLLIILGVQVALRYVLGFFNVPSIYIEMATDLVLAFVFSLWNYRSNSKKYAFRDVYFHRDIAIYFAILSVVTVIFQLV